MALNHLTLSLQFARSDDTAAHRAVLPRHKVARWIRHALAQDAEITVRIVGEDEGRQLNRDYRHKDYATNVLTFDYTQEPVVTADLVLCAPVVEREAREQNKSLEEHYAHLLVHGTLHAQGWDHETSEADAQEMEAYETAILQELGYADPYAPYPAPRTAHPPAKQLVLLRRQSVRQLQKSPPKMEAMARNPLANQGLKENPWTPSCCSPPPSSLAPSTPSPEAAAF